MFVTYEPLPANPEFTALYFVSEIAPGLKLRRRVNDVPVFHSSLYVTTGKPCLGRPTFDVRGLEIKGDERSDRLVTVETFRSLEAAKAFVDRCIGLRKERR